MAIYITPLYTYSTKIYSTTGFGGQKTKNKKLCSFLQFLKNCKGQDSRAFTELIVKEFRILIYLVLSKKNAAGKSRNILLTISGFVAPNDQKMSELLETPSGFELRNV